MVLCQFTSEGEASTLKDFQLPPDIYAAGRLDKDSEGLLLLTNDGPFIHKATDPKFEKEKTYLVQVEKIPTEESLDLLRTGMKMKDYVAKPCHVRLVDEPHLPERNPPIRERKSIPTQWLEIKMTEGKNRQIRHMTAAIGHPTLRLVRIGIGKLNLGGLKPGEFREILKSEAMDSLV